MNQAFMLLTVAMKESTGSEYPDEETLSEMFWMIRATTGMTCVNRNRNSISMMQMVITASNASGICFLRILIFRSIRMTGRPRRDMTAANII